VLGRDLGRRFLSFLITFAIAYVSVLLLIRIFESHFIYFPDTPGRLSGNWSPPGLPVQDVWLRASDGTKLHAWWIPGDGAKFTFLAFHGNAANISNRADVYKFLRSMPANVLAVEYRGYGRSEGKPSEAGLYLDAEAGYEYLINVKGIAPKQIISFGQSLGTAVAAHLAAKREVGGVLLEAPFPSAAAVARRIFWFLPGISLAVASQFDTQKRLKQIKAPVMIVHCADDPVLPFEFGKAVFAAGHEPKRFLKIDGYCHEEASIMAPERYRASLKAFLDSLGR
jgi:fermentation-respiration switch protein FrsA (DUF1100 family)